MVDAEATTTNGSAFGVQVRIASTAPSGIYKVYSTLQDGAAGTATLQATITFTTGANVDVQIVKSGTVAAPAFVATGVGPIAPPDASTTSGVDVHTSYIFGQDAIGCTNLGDGMEATFVPRRPSDSDPLAQRAKAGWKRMFKAVVLNSDFFRRIESASAYD